MWIYGLSGMMRLEDCLKASVPQCAPKGYHRGYHLYTDRGFGGKPGCAGGGNYIGDFRFIREALEQIIAFLNDTLRQINISAEQVSCGSEQVSAGAQTLSRGCGTGRIRGGTGSCYQ